MVKDVGIKTPLTLVRSTVSVTAPLVRVVTEITPYEKSCFGENELTINEKLITRTSTNLT